MIHHSSDQELQGYALDPAACPPELIAHIGSCETCRLAAEDYRLLFTQIKELPAPAIDFDLVQQVMPQLKTVQSRTAADRFVEGFLVVFILLCCIAPMMVFRKYILNMFGGLSPLLMYTLLGGGLIILLFTLLNMYRKYRRQMQWLNFH